MKCYTSKSIFSDVSRFIGFLTERGVKEIVLISNKEDIQKTMTEIEDKIDKIDVILIETERDFKLCYKF